MTYTSTTATEGTVDGTESPRRNVKTEDAALMMRFTGIIYRLTTVIIGCKFILLFIFVNMRTDKHHKGMRKFLTDICQQTAT